MGFSGLLSPILPPVYKPFTISKGEAMAIEQERDVPRQLDFRGCAVAMSVRERMLLEEASEELFPTVDVPLGVVISKLASEAIDARSQRPVEY